MPQTSSCARPSKKLPNGGFSAKKNAWIQKNTERCFLKDLLLTKKTKSWLISSPLTLPPLDVIFFRSKRATQGPRPSSTQRLRLASTPNCLATASWPQGKNMWFYNESFVYVVFYTDVFFGFLKYRRKKNNICSLQIFFCCVLF